MAGLTLARLVSTVERALQPITRIDKVYCWLDSLTAIYWILQERKEWKPFVQNRVTEIRRLIPTQKWFHCPTEENVADIASRGTTPRELISETRWCKGPSWLLLPKEDWPSFKTPSSLTEEAMSEMKASEKRNMNAVLTAFSATAPTVDVTKVIFCENYSCVNRLLLVTALVRRFIVLLKKTKGERKTLKAVTTEDINEAEALWLKSLQRSLLADHRYPQWQEKLGLFVDESGLIRCKGRIEHADVPYSSRNPVLLPNSHPFTDLLILVCHRRVAHNGVKETLSELRSRFWVIRGRQVVRRVLFRCSKCRRFEGNS